MAFLFVLIELEAKAVIDSRRLERVFRCYIVCETMEDYKEGCLKVSGQTICLLATPLLGYTFKGTCDVITVTMAMHKVHKSVL